MAATDDVAEDDRPDLHLPELLLDAPDQTRAGNLHALGLDDRAPAACPRAKPCWMTPATARTMLLVVTLLLAKQHRVRAHRDRRGHREIAAGPSHHLDHERPVVRPRGVVDVIACLDDGVERGVGSDRQRGAADVVVDGRRDAHHPDAVLAGERVRAGERAVATDDDQALDTGRTERVGRPRPSCRFPEARAPGRAEHRAALAPPSTSRPGSPSRAHGPRHDLHHPPVDEPLVAVAHAEQPHPAGRARLRRRPERGVHPRAVSARGEEGQRLHRAAPFSATGAGRCRTRWSTIATPSIAAARK